jgi:hypothetical protein
MQEVLVVLRVVKANTTRQQVRVPTRASTVGKENTIVQQERVQKVIAYNVAKVNIVHQVVQSLKVPVKIVELENIHQC